MAEEPAVTITPQPDWWTEAHRIADKIAELIEEEGAGGTLPAVACLLALKRAVDTGFDDLNDPSPEMARLKKSAALCIKEFAALAGTPG